MLTGAQLGRGGGGVGEWKPPLPILKITQSALILDKKGPYNIAHHCIKFYIQNVALKIYRRKNFLGEKNFSLKGLFFLCLSKYPNSTKIFPKKFWLRTWLMQIADTLEKPPSKSCHWIKNRTIVT